MNTEKLSNSIVNKIKTEHIEQKPKWYFLAKNIFFWVIFGFAALMGAKAVGIILFILNEENFAPIPEARPPFLPLWIRIFPSFWVIFFLLFLLLAILGLHHTERGYKISLKKLIGINIIISLIFGMVSYASGYAEKFETGFQKNVRFYRGFEVKRKNLWVMPEEGRLAGIVLEVKENAGFKDTIEPRNYMGLRPGNTMGPGNTIGTNNNTSFGNKKTIILEDFQKKTWTVEYIGKDMFLNRLKKNDTIRIFGTKISENEFRAIKLSPWKLPRGRR